MLKNVRSVHDEISVGGVGGTLEAKTYQELFNILQDEWNNLDITILNNLVDSMHNRCVLVIKSNGMPINY